MFDFLNILLLSWYSDYKHVEINNIYKFNRTDDNIVHLNNVPCMIKDSDNIVYTVYTQSKANAIGNLYNSS